MTRVKHALLVVVVLVGLPMGVFVVARTRPRLSTDPPTIVERFKAGLRRQGYSGITCTVNTGRKRTVVTCDGSRGTTGASSIEIIEGP